jgi:hypothetical protein
VHSTTAALPRRQASQGEGRRSMSAAPLRFDVREGLAFAFRPDAGEG